MKKGFIKKIAEPSNRIAPLRPPGAMKEMFFIGQCTRCGKCEQICSFKAIKFATGEEYKSFGRMTPIIIPQQTPCTLCMECTRACPTGALRQIAKEKVRMGAAVVDEGMCLSYGKGACKSCVLACPFGEKAISIKDGIAKVDLEFCAGCGMCVPACVGAPSAIKIRPAGSD